MLWLPARTAASVGEVLKLPSRGSRMDFPAAIQSWTSKSRPCRINWISSLISGGRAVRSRGMTKNMASIIPAKIVRSSHFQWYAMKVPLDVAVMGIK